MRSRRRQAPRDDAGHGHRRQPAPVHAKSQRRARVSAESSHPEEPHQSRGGRSNLPPLRGGAGEGDRLCSRNLRAQGSGAIGGEMEGDLACGLGWAGLGFSLERGGGVSESGRGKEGRWAGGPLLRRDGRARTWSTRGGKDRKGKEDGAGRREAWARRGPLGEETHAGR
ncbi:hypothetical protein DAEQUDRAFT_334540 [Daedalea quercina L-15889]|uniref:Uncharacterized protein n=1 Tax=Daedalea quercina L-15889 TaxID=1314783 RepID=A0A165PND4_9APHY|nr:hypothetical protein DAEQUDRAFT_334540 [Daedalea quercina L-15889]